MIGFTYASRFHPPEGWNYNTHGGPVKDKLNVHVILTSHDDTGWLKTVDQYYFEEVSFIYDTLVDTLLKNPDRTYSAVEMAFLSRWWEDQNEDRRNAFRKLVENKQFEFMNGGWCMHDEAAPMFNEMIDQTTRGHQFILSNFGSKAAPKVGWQVDPFGHSATQAWLLTSEVGLQAMFWGRMDDRDFDYRRAHKRMEYVWQGSESIPDAKTFAVQLWGDRGNGGYACPVDYEGGSSNINDNPQRYDYNVDEIVDSLVERIHQQGFDTKGNNILWACGTDFRFQNADRWYRNMDKLIHYLNEDGRINIFYSTAGGYTAEKYKENITWELRRNDLFPYRSGEHQYWTGYFSSRVALKRYIRDSFGILAAARQVEMLSTIATPFAPANDKREPRVGMSWTDNLEGALSLSLHHDGISGTARQDVADDYEQRISKGMAEVELGMEASFKSLFQMDDTETLRFCPRLNISICDVSVESPDAFSIVAYNPLLRKVHSHVFHVPVRVDDTSKDFVVTDVSGNTLQHELKTIPQRILELPKMYINKFAMSSADVQKARTDLANPATHVLRFSADLPPLGATAFRIQKAEKRLRKGDRDTSPPKVMKIENDFFTITVSKKNPRVLVITNKSTQSQQNVRVDWGYYTPAGSGAYLFNPQNSKFTKPDGIDKSSISVHIGEVSSEIRFNMEETRPLASHVVRLYQTSRFIEVEYVAGPILGGKELSIRYSTDIQSGKVFYTDANGREMIKRVRDERQPGFTGDFSIQDDPVAGNYYPVNAMISLEDENTQFTILTDSTQGGSSLASGSIELMVNRRLMHDDHKGVEEPLIETMCGCGGKNLNTCDCEGLTVRGIHRLIIDTPSEANNLRRKLMSELQYRPTLMFAKGPMNSFTSKSFLASEIPESLNLLSLSVNVIEKFHGKVLVRFEHMYAKDEHDELSKPVTFDMCAMFSSRVVTFIQEMTLSANKEIQDKQNFVWNVAEEVDSKKVHSRISQSTPSGSLCHVTLDPMQVRTYFIGFGTVDFGEFVQVEE